MGIWADVATLAPFGSEKKTPPEKTNPGLTHCLPGASFVRAEGLAGLSERWVSENPSESANTAHLSSPPTLRNQKTLQNPPFLVGEAQSALSAKAIQ